ncbi:universal stress protein [Bermanella sp. R86510]|uniref:universal stress protein n=1 Tax=unclassified Bermanella TaxID=2627862 RepID=UPI0037C70D4F
MLAINNVLLILDQELENEVAIKRAMQLCQEQDAKLYVTSYVYNHACEEGSLIDLDIRHNFQELLIERTEKWALETLQQCYLPSDTPLSICWCNHAYQAAIENSRQASFDLIIKAAAKHHSLVDRVMQHQDWNLLKQSPAPVLLVKQKAAWESRNIIAAVDATSTDDAHKHINEHIFEFAELINKDQLYTIHLVNSYPIMSLALASLPDTPIPEDLQQYVMDQHYNAAEALAAKYNIAENNMHVKEGEAEEVITETSQHLDADVVIIGILADASLSSVLLGSTLEHVLDNTDSDVLGIKPQDGVGDLEE